LPPCITYQAKEISGKKWFNARRAMRSYYLDAGQKELQTLALKVRNNFIFIAWACERHCPRHQRPPTYIPRLKKLSSGETSWESLLP